MAKASASTLAVRSPITSTTLLSRFATWAFSRGSHQCALCHAWIGAEMGSRDTLAPCPKGTQRQLLDLKGVLPWQQHAISVAKGQALATTFLTHR